MVFHLQKTDSSYYIYFNGLYGSQTENTTNGENDPQFRSLYDHDLDSPFTETEIRKAVFEQKKLEKFRYRQSNFGSF